MVYVDDVHREPIKNHFHAVHDVDGIICGALFKKVVFLNLQRHGSNMLLVTGYVKFLQKRRIMSLIDRTNMMIKRTNMVI